MAADKSTEEHYEVWYAEADGKRRHQKAETEAQAVEIAEDHHLSGFDDVTVHKVVTAVTTTDVKVDLPDREPAAPADA